MSNQSASSNSSFAGSIHSVLANVFVSNGNQQKKQLSSNYLQANDQSQQQASLTQNTPLLSQVEALNLFEQALNEVDQGDELYRAEGKREASADIKTQPPQTSPLTKPNVQLPNLNAVSTAASHKESVTSTATAVEQGASLQVVEEEKSPELSPEVEKYLQEVHKDAQQAPKEIAIVDDIKNLPKKNQFVSEPVIVVPITPQIEKKGKRKSPKFSVRWLVEWSQKIIKMFAGKVVYLQPAENQ